MSMRGRIAVLNTDLSATMTQIEKGLEELHSLHRADGDEPAASKPRSTRPIEEKKTNVVKADRTAEQNK